MTKSDVTVTACRDNSDYVKCPRCWHWHSWKQGCPWQVDGKDDNDRHIICGRCEDVLFEDHPTIRSWRQSKRIESS